MSNKSLINFGPFSNKSELLVQKWEIGFFFTKKKLIKKSTYGEAREN